MGHSFGAEVREGLWKRVEEARAKDQPKIEVELLEEIAAGERSLAVT